MWPEYVKVLITLSQERPTFSTISHASWMCKLLKIDSWITQDAPSSLPHPATTVGERSIQKPSSFAYSNCPEVRRSGRQWLLLGIVLRAGINPKHIVCLLSCMLCRIVVITAKTTFRPTCCLPHPSSGDAENFLGANRFWCQRSITNPGLGNQVA